MDEPYFVEKQRRLLESILRRLTASKDISEHNKKAMFAFFDELEASKKLSFAGRLHYTEGLPLLAIHLKHDLKKRFEDVTKQDLMKFFSKLEVGFKIKNSTMLVGRLGTPRTMFGPYKPSSMNLRRSSVRRFYKWFNNVCMNCKHDWFGIDRVCPKCKSNRVEYDEEDPYISKWIPTRIRVDKTVNGDDILSREEILKIVNAATHPRDKALILTCFDTNTRCSEILTPRIRDLDLKEGELNIYIHKTKMHDIRFLTFSAPALATWLNCHPDKNNPEAPLFVSIGPNSYGKALKHHGFDQALKKAARRAGILETEEEKKSGKQTGKRKRLWVHLLRHSRTSDLFDKGFTLPEVRDLGGWKSASSIPIDVYSHTKKSMLKKKQRIKEGLDVAEDEDKKNFLEPKKCLNPDCGAVNEPGAKVCKDCRSYLDIKDVMEDKKAEVERKKQEKAEFASAIFRAMRKINADEELTYEDGVKIIESELVA